MLIFYYFKLFSCVLISFIISSLTVSMNCVKQNTFFRGRNTFWRPSWISVWRSQLITFFEFSDVQKAHSLNIKPFLLQEKYYASLASEAGTKTLPSVLTKIREESSIRFLHNLKHYRQDIYKIIDDDTYEIISNGKREILCWP